MEEYKVEGEEDEEIDFVPTATTPIETEPGFNWRLCLVGRFLQIGTFDFLAMQQTLASIWKPGKGVFIKELEDNRFIFQFYHEIDIKRVLDGSPWYFNRKALILARMTQDCNPRNLPLTSLDVWVQVHDLQIGFMNSNVLKALGNQMGRFVDTCPKNLLGTWRDHMRVRVTLDLNNPLKRRMKIRKTKDEFFG